MITNIITKTKDKIWVRLKENFYIHRIKDSNIVQNINFDVHSQKKLLISYVVTGYFVNIEKTNGKTLINEIFKIVKIFSELGYCIDIIDCNNIQSVKLVSEKKYDLIFGFGESFYQITKLQPEAISILYMTENHPFISYREEKRRLDYYFTRHGRYIKLERSGNFYKLHHLDTKYSYVITLSETEPLLNHYKNPYTIFPTGIINPQLISTKKNHQLSRKHFLWLGSRGAIHKGLDLLIDIFSKRDDIILHVCGLSVKEKKLINFPKRKNIIEYGYIDIKSDIFLKIMEKCTYIILPSCSEGFSTSITTGMLHGLIPIVMKDTGFNRLGDNAIFLDDYRLDYLNNKLNELAVESPEKLNIFSKKVFDYAHNNFIISVFERNFRNIIIDILLRENEKPKDLDTHNINGMFINYKTY